MAVSPDGRTLAMGGNQGEGGQEPGLVKLWDATSGRELTALRWSFSQK